MTCDVREWLAWEKEAIVQAHVDLERLDAFVNVAEEANERLKAHEGLFMPGSALPGYRKELEAALKANLRLCLCLGNEIEWTYIAEQHLEEAKKNG